MRKRVPPHMRCGSREYARHKHNREIMRKHLEETYVPDSEFEPELIRDTEFIKDSLHPSERRSLKQLTLE